MPVTLVDDHVHNDGTRCHTKWNDEQDEEYVQMARHHCGNLTVIGTPACMVCGTPHPAVPAEGGDSSLG